MPRHAHRQDTRANNEAAVHTHTAAFPRVQATRAPAATHAGLFPFPTIFPAGILGEHKQKSASTLLDPAARSPECVQSRAHPPPQKKNNKKKKL